MSLDFRDRQLIKELSSICRNVLGKEGYQFNSFENDFKDGTNLLHLLEIVGKTKINNGRWHKNAKNIYWQLENISLALKFLEQKGIKITNISADDIRAGKIKPTLSLINLIVKNFQIDSITEDNEKSTNSLFTWCKKTTINMNVNITDFDNSWKSGLAFCALIHSFHPELIP